MNEIRCVGCPRWLGVQQAGYIESRSHGRTWRIVTGDVICEQCGAVLRIVDGRPTPALFTFNGRPVSPGELKAALGHALGAGYHAA